MASSRPGRASASATTSRDFVRNFSIQDLQFDALGSLAGPGRRYIAAGMKSARRGLADELSRARDRAAALQDETRRHVRSSRKMPLSTFQ